MSWINKKKEINELINQIESEDCYIRFVRELKSLLKDDNIYVASIDGVNRMVVYHGYRLTSIDEIKDYFTVQDRVPKSMYARVADIAFDSKHKKVFVNTVNNIVGHKVASYISGYVHMDNKMYKNKNEIYTAYKQEIDMKAICSMCEESEIVDDGKSVICDGVAYITSDKELLNNEFRDHYAIEGLISFGNKIAWNKVSKEAFVHIKDKLILKNLADKDIELYRDDNNNRSDTLCKPYPVAIASDNEYIFMYNIK